MKSFLKKSFWLGIGFIGAFILWTLLVRCVNVEAIGPSETTVGFAKLNGFVHSVTGVNMSLYNITDWLGLVPIGVALCFAVIGLIQWIKRKRIRAVDRSILALGGFYIAVIFVYVFFEYVIINYRPVLINEHLEASYPSSTTMLVTCVMPTAIMQIRERIKHKILRYSLTSMCCIFTAFMVIGRLISGVHWLSDIVGGMLISAGLVLIYYSGSK